MNITRKEVQLFEVIAKSNFVDTAANMEYADGTPATDRDFRAIMTMRAALSVLQTMGLVDKNITLDLRTPYQP